MKMKQDSDFNPITIVLETQEEAEAVWLAVDHAFKKEDEKIEPNIGKKRALMELSNWFSEQAHLAP